MSESLGIVRVQAAPLVVQAEDAEELPLDWEAQFVMRGQAVRVFAPCGCYYTFYRKDGRVDLLETYHTGTGCLSSRGGRCEHSWSKPIELAREFLRQEGDAQPITLPAD